MKKARALLGPLSLLVATAFGCTVIAEVDRDKIPDEGSAGTPDAGGGSAEPGIGGEGAAPEGGAGGGGAAGEGGGSSGEGGSSSGEGGSGVGGSGGDNGCSLADHGGCGESELCCNVGVTPTCVEGSLAQCGACGAPCDPISADGCTERECTCGGGPACSGLTPRCTEHGCAECEDDGDCGGSESQCVDGTCKACDPSDNAGCGENEPICNSNNVCEPCSGNCPGDQVCDVSGACSGCDDHTDCAESASAPICDETSVAGVFQCRACVDDADCVANLGLGQCFDGQCAACDPHDHAGCGGNTPRCVAQGGSFSCEGCTEQFCLEESTEPVCATSGASQGECVTCDATNTSECPDEAPFCLLSNNTCVECTGDADCDDPAEPLCDPTTHACVPCTDPAVSAGADAACDEKVDGSRCVETGALAGRCGACDPSDDEGCGTSAPQCRETSATCVQCLEHMDCAEVEDKPFCDTTSHECVECSTDVACGEKVCSSGSCVACTADQDCENHPGGDYCTAAGCQTCDPADHAGCEGAFLCSASYECVECLAQSDCGSQVCSNGACSSCVAGGNDCAGHPDGAVCVELAGGGTGCAACDPVSDAGCTAEQCVLVASVPTCKGCEPGTADGCLPSEICSAAFECEPAPTP